MDGRTDGWREGWTDGGWSDEGRARLKEGWMEGEGGRGGGMEKEVGMDGDSEGGGMFEW